MTLRRLLPHPWLSALLFIIWFLLVNNPKIGSILMAGALAIAIPLGLLVALEHRDGVPIDELRRERLRVLTCTALCRLRGPAAGRERERHQAGQDYCCGRCPNRHGVRLRRAPCRQAPRGAR